MVGRIARAWGIQEAIDLDDTDKEFFEMAQKLGEGLDGFCKALAVDLLNLQRDREGSLVHTAALLRQGRSKSL